MKWPIAVSYGGGDNSRALLEGMIERVVRPDVILFSDTQGERPLTYANNKEYSDHLVSKGFPPITVVGDFRQSLETECLTANTLPSIVFGFKSCSDKYKIRPQNRFLSSWEPALKAWANGGKVVKLIGYDAGEKHRIKNYDDARFVVRYPLVEWGWDRGHCKKVVIEAGFKPSKSACFFCPSMKKHEVLRLAKEEPELFKRASFMEENATAVTTAKGLGRTWSWRDLVAADESQLKMFEDLPDEMPCGCFEASSEENA